MAIDVTAYAETSASWEQLEARFVPALESVDAHWLPALTFGSQLPSASIDVGPAELISVTLREGLLLAHTRTSPWGPGFHQRVVAVLDALAVQLDGGWTQVRDATGYHRARDREELERHFLRWAHALWSLDPYQLDRATVCLGLGEGPAEVPPGHVASPVGFKDRDWIEATRDALARTLRAPSTPPEVAAREAFLWWHQTPDGYDWAQLGRSICSTDVIWRGLPDGDTPLQEEARQRALTCFENALRIDPRAQVPWAELHRLYQLLGRSEEAAFLERRRATTAWAPFAGGYREGWIRRRLGGHWRVTLPGWLRASCGLDGHDVYFDDQVTVHLSLLRASQVPGPFSPEAEVRHHLVGLTPERRARASSELLDNGSAQGYLVVVPSDRPERDSLIQGQMGQNDERVGFTVVARTPEGREVARRMSLSLRPLVGSTVLG